MSLLASLSCYVMGPDPDHYASYELETGAEASSVDVDYLVGPSSLGVRVSY